MLLLSYIIYAKKRKRHCNFDIESSTYMLLDPSCILTIFVSCITSFFSSMRNSLLATLPPLAMSFSPIPVPTYFSRTAHPAILH